MSKSKLMLLLLLLSFVLLRLAVAQSEPQAVVYQPPKQLVIELEVPAPVAEVWKAFSTSEGLSTWLFPHATVDLKPGGDWLVHFPGGSTGGGTIVSFVPERELVISALAPDKFPQVRETRTRAVFQFEARGNSTVVRLTQTGWKSGDEWTRAYAYLTAGNAQLLATLHQRFVDGPTDWDKVMGNAKAKTN
ncbi:SRPBCC domain-containing protein [Telmatobacter sp. DSM 110680]|uniref:SRPBCC domain-containing protein n=1 Tax=Telmatobacter sp. DSM 110680 TaxID=3036704 RepID=A0AAU7DCD4_9BACT